MSGVYLTWLADELRAAGLTVVEVDGWQYRARGSGGYASGRPICVMEHHTASPPSSDGWPDANYICFGDPDAPIANLYLNRAGVVWVCAGGATNTNGKGQSMTFSRGVVPVDSMNTYACGIECANDGVGGPWERAQIDALILTANTVNRRLGNLPTDLAGHVHYSPGRKIDPAQADAVAGPWVPVDMGNGAGSWDLESMRAEHAARAGGAPVDMGDDPMRILVLTDLPDGPAILLTGHVGTWLDPGRYTAFHTAYPSIVDERTTSADLANVVLTGRVPTDSAGNPVASWDVLD